MFDFGFGELLLIAVVALVVLGPERLPKVARLAGLWARKARAQWNAVKAELENELADEELRRSLRETSDAWREGSEALRKGAQQIQSLPETVRNDPGVVDTLALMTSLNAEQQAAQAAPEAPVQVSNAPAADVGDVVAPKPVETTAPQAEIDPAQMSLLDPDTQMSLLLPLATHPGDPEERRSP